MLDGPVLDMHVGLGNREGVDIGRIKVTKTVTVIEEAVSGLVGANGRERPLSWRSLQGASNIRLI
jgi:hypothetical protein